jgi:hypothetical protein
MRPGATIVLEGNDTMSGLKGIALAPLLLSLQVAASFADNPPKLDVDTTCNAAYRFAISGSRDKDKEACLDDEHAAEDTVGKNWSKFSADDKTTCIGMVKTGGPASYVELLSCLEIMRDAKEYSEEDSPKQSDRPAQSTHRRRR